VNSAQLPGLASSSLISGSFQSVAVSKSPPSAFSEGLLNAGAYHWPSMRATRGLSLLSSSAKVPTSSSTPNSHSET
jgi:hypothetical protein